MMPEPHRNGRDGTNNMQLLAVAIGEYSTHFAVKSLRYLNTRQALSSSLAHVLRRTDGLMMPEPRQMSHDDAQQPAAAGHGHR